MIGDIIFILVYLATEFLNYMLGYTVIFGATLTKTKSKWIFATIVVLIFHFAMYLGAGIEVSCNMSIVSMTVIPFFLLQPVMKKNIILYPFIVIGVSVFGVCASFILAAILGVPEYEMIDTAWSGIFCQTISILFMVLIVMYRKRKNVEKYQINLNWKQYIILYAVVISLFFLLAPIQSLSREIKNYSEINYVGMSASLACIVLVVVTIWQAVSATREKQLQERNAMNEKFMELQKEYYEQLVNQDEKMRRFRHDMNAHIQVMKALCEENDNPKMKNYLEAIIKESAINEVKVYTGNRAVDAIIRRMLGDAKKRKIKVEINGRLPEKMQIQEFDLCTMVSNLLKNAIEACEKIDDRGKKCIHFETGVYNTHFYLLIKNTVVETVVVKNHQLCTTKKDSKNHGIGIRNVQEAVKKYDGKLELRCEDGWFIAEVNI